METYKLEDDLWFAGKTSLIKAQWNAVFNKEPPSTLQHVLSTFRYSEPHLTKDKHPDSKDGFYIELALSADPEEPYRTLWFSRELSTQEQREIEYGYQLVVAGLFKPSVGQ